MRATWLLVVLACTVAKAEEPSAPFPVRTFLQNYCTDCHTGDDGEAGLNLEFDDMPVVADQFDAWTSILQKVGGHEMPPEDTDQPSSAERTAFVEWVRAGLTSLDCAEEEIPERTTLRRLNRFEYNRVVQALFGMPTLQPAKDFPADTVGEGFDNIGEVLSLPPLLMEKYLAAGESVTAQLRADQDAWRRLWGKQAGKGTNKIDSAHVSRRVRRLARQAFRRPVTDDEIDRLISLYESAIGEDVPVDAALELVVQAVLVSPNFLFRLEEDPQTWNAEHPVALDSHALAARLSFFLWSSLPDAELNRLADAGRLTDVEVLAQQTRRLIQDPRSDGFVESFAGQWLQLRLLSQVKPDPDLFPQFDAALRTAMVEETSAFVRYLLRQNRSVLDLIDSDYTFLNARLAKHYGVADIQGDSLRRVQLADRRRGGVLTQASILTLTSNPTRTSPVKRGKWILENILGTPPPPPPPNVPELEEGEELLGSLRERMKQHRENPSCAVCHRKMDPLGFGFENFDAVGRWREKDGQYPIEPGGELPGNITFTTPAELRRILLDDSTQFTNCLVRKLLTYALGRALTSRDQCLVDELVAQTEQSGHGMADLIVRLTVSDAFRFSGNYAAQQSQELEQQNDE